MSTSNGSIGTNSLWQKDKDHFLHPWTHFDSFKREGSLVIREAQGAYVTDDSGRRYLDGIGGLWWVLNGTRPSAASTLKSAWSGSSSAYGGTSTSSLSPRPGRLRLPLRPVP